MIYNGDNLKGRILYQKIELYFVRLLLNDVFMVLTIYFHLFRLPKLLGLALRFVMPWRNMNTNTRLYLQGDFHIQSGRTPAPIAVRNVLVGQ